jgi:hypothetical protein
LPRTGRPKVLYVMGVGRSGSTILGVALGNSEGVLFAGELDKWFAREGRPRRDGARLQAFWQDVLGETGDASDVFAARTGWLERSSGLFDPRKWRARRRLRNRYRGVSEQLFVALARRGQATHVVDTSHYPLRARELQELEGIELYLLWLVRDPHSVVASLGRRDVAERHFGVLAANAYLWLTNLLSLRVFLRQPSATRTSSPIRTVCSRRSCGSPARRPQLPTCRTWTPVCPFTATGSSRARSSRSTHGPTRPRTVRC